MPPRAGGSPTFDPNKKEYRAAKVPPEVKIELHNLKTELAELKTKVFNMEQYFSPERADYKWDKVKVCFVGGVLGDFHDVISRKYTLEAKDVHDHTVIIQKANMLYMVVTV